MFISEADHAGRTEEGLFRLEQGEQTPRLFFRRPPGDGTHSPMVKAAGKCRPLVENNFTISAYQNVRYWHLADIQAASENVRFRG